MPETTFRFLSVLSHPQLMDEKIKVYMKLNVFFFVCVRFKPILLKKKKKAGVKLLYNIVLVSAIQQSDSDIYISTS